MTAVLIKHLFLVGPASVGKSSVGGVLAKHLKLPFKDVDLEFCDRIENVGDHMQNKGYESYARSNSLLVERLINEATTPTVFALPAGFFVHESVPDLAPKHVKLLHRHGLTILLLPSMRPEDSANLIAERQLQRWGNVMTGENEKDRFIRRFHIYVQHGDVKIFSSDSPKNIATMIIAELRLRKLI